MMISDLTSVGPYGLRRTRRIRETKGIQLPWRGGDEWVICFGSLPRDCANRVWFGPGGASESYRFICLHLLDLSDGTHHRVHTLF